MTILAKRPYRPGDPLPEVGSLCVVAGSNTDIESDQDRAYSERRVIGYTPDGVFVCFQTRDYWPTVERLTNCWFGDLSGTQWFTRDESEAMHKHREWRDTPPD